MTSQSTPTVLFNGYIASVLNVAALRLYDVSRLTGGAKLSVDGSVYRGDGSGGIYVYEPTSTATDDGLTAIAPAAGSGRWLISAGKGLTGSIGPAGPIGATGGNVISVGLFKDMATITVGTGTNLIQTAGYTTAGVGVARYRVGATTDPAAPVSLHSGNTANGRPVYLAEPFPTVDMFGAIPDGVTDSRPAFQAGAQFCAGATLEVPGTGSYYWSPGGLDIAGLGNTTLRGHASLEGGGGMIVVDGNVFLTNSSPSYTTFNLIRIAATGKTPLTVNLYTQPKGGVWSYSTIEGCYFANFLNWNTVVLGLHVNNNNFANFRQVNLGGSDNDFSYNYSNYDPRDTTMTTDDSFWLFGAMGATGFSHNYITVLRSGATDPIVLGWSITNQCRCVHNQLDGGSKYNMRFFSGTTAMVSYDNRQDSAATFSANGYVPICVISSDDIVIRDHKIGNLESGAPFITFLGATPRITVTDCLPAAASTDNSYHEIYYAPAASHRFSGPIKVVGHSVPKTWSPINGDWISAPHFDRLITNAGDTANPQIVYLDMSQLAVGQVINCCRSDTTRKWVIYDQTNSAILYDSSVNTGSQFFRLTCVSLGHALLDITPPTATTTTTTTTPSS